MEPKKDHEYCEGCGREFPIEALYEGYCVECEMDGENEDYDVEEDEEDEEEY